MMKAMWESQRRSYADLYETAALKTMLLWLTSHVEQVKRKIPGARLPQRQQSIDPLDLTWPLFGAWLSGCTMAGKR
jgi:hypothetical protein